MFIYRRTIHVQDTDATGVVYFANLLQIGLETFEEFLLSKGFSIGEMVRKNQFFLPIVHTEGDFFASLIVGDKTEVHLSFTKVGTSSFTHSSEIYKQAKRMGTVTIVHVAYCPEKKEAIPIPNEIKEIIGGL